MIEHVFGGDWTEDKLRRLREYLIAYRNIFTSNARASYFRTWYVDAFAGTGSRTSPSASKALADQGEGLYVDNETAGFLDGSAKIALGIPSPFHRYFFIEGSKRKVEALRKTVISEFPLLIDRTEIKTDDANTALCRWCRERDWSKDRAVVFLDPYGMQVDWATVQLLGETRGVDLWYLFSLGGVIRMLTRDGLIEETWQRRLDNVFGTTDWREHFYRTAIEPGLFGEHDVTHRDATVKNVQKYIEDRLKTAFVEVAPSLVLRNSQSFPQFALCFAASNEKGAKPALKIATHLLKEG
jgi:three-Cys-motif partner protein